MQELLDLILKNITTHPDDVVIDTSTEDNIIIYTITVNPEDMGRVIGKSGKVIRAIRSLAHVVGIRKNERYRVNVAEVGDGPGASSAPSDDPQTDDPTDQPVEEPTVATVAPDEPAAPAVVEEVAVEEAPPADDDITAGAIEVTPEPDKK